MSDKTIDTTSFDQMLNKHARKFMLQWNLQSFKKTHPRLYTTIIHAMIEAVDKSSRPWFSMDWKPKLEGPYIVKVRYTNYRKKGRTVIMYRIKRWYVHDECSKGLFTTGDLSENGEYIGWMPVPGHDYSKPSIQQ